MLAYNFPLSADDAKKTLVWLDAEESPLIKAKPLLLTPSRLTLLGPVKAGWYKIDGIGCPFPEFSGKIGKAISPR